MTRHENHCKSVLKHNCERSRQITKFKRNKYIMESKKRMGDIQYMLTRDLIEA